METFKKVLSITLLILSLSILAACGGKDPLAEGKTQINFWGWGDQSEVAVFRSLVDQYNETNEDNIFVNYTQKPSSGYESSMERTLSGSRAPDIFYVGDGTVKKWVELDYLYDITELVNNSEVIDLENIWPTAVSRYRYNKENRTSNETDPIYALPKDIGPTVIYYNADALKAVGVTIVSKDLDDATITSEEQQGFNLEAKIFNNRIPMTWEETQELSYLLTKKHNANAITDYGYYTEWWFNYVWSVGGDVLTMNNNGDYEFSLGSETPNGENLPSTRDAFKHFVDLSTVHETSPKPNTISTVGKTNYFTTGKVAMMVDGRWSTVTIRKDANFDWDVAPLPVHENGIQAGHSGSMGFGIWKRTSKSQEAFKFMEYLSGPIGQAAQSETGFNIPNQIDLANTEVFLQSDQKPKNAKTFIEAAMHQRPGDWAYLPDSAWITVWAPTLNGAVLNGQTNIDQFFNQVTSATNQILKTYTE
ncbi:ABC transporter substrate-binding protein [Acholeplasma granularum]|uniref:ABC transporter substrate-binding protein n=1 Tax=Acholeplasma granularum TaxID=264635 RepID=UPI00046FA54A|nr:sugar ABC transporter substrate-binding protein [Acholeplasma granularum]